MLGAGPARFSSRCAWITGGLCQKVSSALSGCSGSGMEMEMAAQSQPRQSLACVCIPGRPSRQQKLTLFSDVELTLNGLCSRGVVAPCVYPKQYCICVSRTRNTCIGRITVRRLL